VDPIFLFFLLFITFVNNRAPMSCSVDINAVTSEKLSSWLYYDQ